MDLHKMIAELEAERDRLDHAILALERLARGVAQGKRGRPPKWLQELTGENVEAINAGLTKAQANGKK